MIEIEHTQVGGLEAAIRGMRNPMNSWDKSDSRYAEFPNNDVYCAGENDLQLMRNLVKAGSDHSKFMRMIVVYCDVTAPLYWWKELDTYKVGTVRNSCSTMHKIHENAFTTDDFSCEHLFKENDEKATPEYYERRSPIFSPYSMLEVMINVLNTCREKFIETGDKVWWWQMIQILPLSYNQRATLMLNYAVLRNIYHARKNHKLDEWHEFCNWIESLPYSELITEDFNK